MPPTIAVGVRPVQRFAAPSPSGRKHVQPGGLVVVDDGTSLSFIVPPSAASVGPCSGDRWS
jgi:hypothetical protein